jgi:hypothetical protein
MTERFLNVEERPDLIRDTNSNAIINRNTSAYDLAKRRAKEAQSQRDEIRTATREINNIKSEMHEIKGLLQKLVER